jgi:dTDP-4-dehydrorhamnose reductase
VTDSPHAITLRTSIIGHELNTSHALVDWLLSSRGQVQGYTQAIFSGLPTVELARVIHDYVLPDTGLYGLYHVSAEPIAKHDLLRLLADIYHKEITIIPSDEIVIDRSLNSDRFRSTTGYEPPIWPELITMMRRTHQQTGGLIDV